ncbi:uncharacterized protein LOC113054208 [Carassius auratus]|uniref:Uncharacterized protein LOC113054208 n=1 Tax=Carassius auratus TaxID=7957 RepID=A0A6P6KVT6_CARAU|nr:uncharacterized protein LOC113054208 [Carassius auratus]
MNYGLYGPSYRTVNKLICSCVSGVSGEVHVFISSGEDVRLPCNNALQDCTSTTWIYNRFRHSAAVELITLGIKKKDTERHERLSLGSKCSLNIRNISTEDYGSYICQQWTGEKKDQKQEPDAGVYLHVLHVSSSHTEISAGLSVTLFCQLYSYPRVSCDDWIRSERIHLFWVNQAGVKSDSRYQISSSSDHCIISLNTTLLNEDHNREWRCEVTQRDQVKTSVTYTVKSSAEAGSTTSVIPVHSTHSQDPSTTNTHTTKEILTILKTAVFAAPTVILLQIICARRAERKDSQQPEEIEMNTITE